jgi:hypothetical protein
MSPANKGLERTRSRPNGLREPCRSIQCSTGATKVRQGMRALYD